MHLGHYKGPHSYGQGELEINSKIGLSLLSRKIKVSPEDLLP